MRIADDWFVEFLDKSIVNDCFVIDGHEECYDFMFCEDDDTEFVDYSDNGEYSFHAFDIEMDTACSSGILMKDNTTGSVVGFYYDFQVWISPECRGQGLSSEMICLYSEYFQDSAWPKYQDDGPITGLGFSHGGYKAHVRARERFIERNMVGKPEMACV